MTDYQLYIIEIIIVALALIISIVLHELAHGYVALLNGDNTAKLSGRLSPNPFRHFDLMGVALLLVIRVGYAKPVPVNPLNFRRRRLGLFTVAIAGVTVNMLLSFFASGTLVALSFIESEALIIECIRTLFYALAFYNLFLFFFNLLPFYPLDGFRVIESATKFTNPIAKFFRNYGYSIMFLLIGLSFIQNLFAGAGMPGWINILGTYLNTCSQFVYKGFIKFWCLIFGA